MKNPIKLRYLLMVVLAIALVACAAPAAPGEAPAAEAPAAEEADAGAIEIFSWWTSGGEVEALDALYAVFLEQYPGVEIENALYEWR